MKTALTLVLLAALLATLAPGQKLNLTFPESLAAAAKEKAEINLDAATLAAGAGLVAGAVPKDLVGKLKGMKELKILSYEFEKPGQYTAKDLEPLRKQVGPGSGWSSIVSVKEKNERTDIMVYREGEKLSGFLLISEEPKEIAIIYVLGEMSMASLQEIVKSTVAYDLGSAKAAQAQ
jgi:hypothetical protein